MMDPPAGSLPPTFDSNFKVEDESLTKATYLLKEDITGVETVAVGQDGKLGLVDHHGRVGMLAICINFNNSQLLSNQPGMQQLGEPLHMEHT